MYLHSPSAPTLTAAELPSTAQRTNVPLGMRPLSSTMSRSRFTNPNAPLTMTLHVSTANGTIRKAA